MPEFFSKMKKIEWFLFRYSFPLYYFAVKKIEYKLDETDKTESIR